MPWTKWNLVTCRKLAGTGADRFRAFSTMEGTWWHWVGGSMEAAGPGSRRQLSDHKLYQQLTSQSKPHKVPRINEVRSTLYDPQMNGKTCLNHFLWFPYSSSPNSSRCFLRDEQRWRNVVDTNMYCLLFSRKDASSLPQLKRATLSQVVSYPKWPVLNNWWW